MNIAIAITASANTDSERRDTREAAVTNRNEQNKMNSDWIVVIFCCAAVVINHEIIHLNV